MRRALAALRSPWRPFYLSANKNKIKKSRILSVALTRFCETKPKIIGLSSSNNKRVEAAVHKWLQPPASLATIHRAESVDGKTAMTFANASAIRRALENAGVELIDENGGGPGARLKRRLG
jgi:hypothetical protein